MYSIRGSEQNFRRTGVQIARDGKFRLGDVYTNKLSGVTSRGKIYRNEHNYHLETIPLKEI